MDNATFAKIKTLVNKAADDARTNAGYSGEPGDGGASDMLNNLRYYEMGRDGVTPPEWAKRLKDNDKLSDPRYQEYLKLKDEFGE